MSAVLYAIRPGEKYFKLSESGTVQVSDDGRTSFVASAQGRHRYLIVDAAQKDRVTQTYVELASAKPVVRAPRRRPDAVKPAAAAAPAEKKP